MVRRSKPGELLARNAKAKAALAVVHAAVNTFN